MEGRADGGSPGNREDDARESGRNRVRDHVLQRVLLNPDLQVPGRVGETSPAAVRNGEVSAHISPSP